MVTSIPNLPSERGYYDSDDTDYFGSDAVSEEQEFSEEDRKILCNWTTETRYFRRARFNIVIDVFQVEGFPKKWTFDIPFPIGDEDFKPLVFHGKVESIEQYWLFPAEAVSVAEQWLIDAIGEREDTPTDT